MTISENKKFSRKISNRLTDALVRKTKPREKNFKLFNGGHLFLLIITESAKYWRYKYDFAGKEKTLALGVYPDVSLAEARDARDKARKQLRNNIDSNLVKKLT